MKKRFLAVVPITALALAGCTAPTAGSDPATLDVQAEVYGLAYLAEQIGGERVSVGQIVPAGTEVHGYEVSPAQVASLGAADLVIVIDTLAAAVDEAVEAAQPASVVDVAQVLTTQEAVAHEDEDEDHADEEGAPGAFDAHLWLAVAQMPTLITEIAARLTALDPDGADVYATNAADLSERFVELDAAYAQGLATCERDTVIVTHPAYGYLLQPYGIAQVGVSGFDEESEPSPARLAEIGEAARDNGATTVFFGSSSSPTVAQVLADELGLEVDVLSTIDSAPDGEDYFTLAEANLLALRTALGCS